MENIKNIRMLTVMLMLSLYDVIIYLHVCILNLLLWNGRGSPQRQHDDWIPLVSVPGLCVVFSFCFLCVLLPVVRGWFWTAVLVPIPDWWTTTLTAYANRQMSCLPSGLAYSSAPIAFEGLYKSLERLSVCSCPVQKAACHWVKLFFAQWQIV